ncbi:MAG: transketolase family protein [Planctomycetota bacterium]|nr:MAG: transketolase family protein [Planctomycetota bacterium]
MVDMKPTKNGFGEGLVELGRRNPRVVALGCDITGSVMVSLFKDAFPDRFFSIGIAEQNAAQIAAGLSLAGFVPFFSTYGVFASGRCWDQIRTTICYTELNVKIGGAHGGISVGPDGATHQALEEIGNMRAIPNMTVIVPADATETRKATIAAGEMLGPCYVRFGREAVPSWTKEDDPFEIGNANLVRDGNDVAVIACGVMVYEALCAAEELEKEGISVRVVNLHTVKPIDTGAIVSCAEKCGCIVAAEEHQIYGGFCGAVAEQVVQHCPVPMEFVAVDDRFGESGDPEELMSEFGLTSSDIVSAIRNVLKRSGK